MADEMQHTDMSKGRLSSGFTSAGSSVPLQDRAVIVPGPNFDKSVYHVANDATQGGLVNFRNILRTGETATDQDMCYPDGQRIDWSSDDAYTRAVDQIANAAAERIQTNPHTKALLEKDHWTRGDRLEWERRTSEIVSEETDKIPGLGQYRIAQENIPLASYPLPPKPQDDPLIDKMTADRRATQVNNLSTDIEHNTGTIEFDCETMSITKGSALQRIEDRLLPQNASAVDDYKHASSYFYGSGFVEFANDAVPRASAHAFIVSSATGNIIEGTANGEGNMSPYQNMQPGYGFEDFARGRVAISTQAAYAPNISALAKNPDLLAELQNDRKNFPLQRFTDELDNLSGRIKEGVNEIRDTPEFQTLEQFDQIEKTRKLTPDEENIRRDIYENSEISPELKALGRDYGAYKGGLNRLYGVVEDNPENLKQFDNFLRHENEKFSSMQTDTPYLYKGSGGEIEAGGTIESEAQSEIAYTRQDVQKRLDDLMPKTPDLALPTIKSSDQPQANAGVYSP